MVYNSLNKIRAERNISLRQLEKMSGVSRTALNKIENFECNPTQETMIMISQALNEAVPDVFDLRYK